MAGTVPHKGKRKEETNQGFQGDYITYGASNTSYKMRWMIKVMHIPHIYDNKNYNIIAIKSKMMFNQNDSYPFYISRKNRYDVDLV